MFKGFVKRAASEVIHETSKQVKKKANVEIEQARPLACAACFLIGYFILGNPQAPSQTANITNIIIRS